MTAAYAYFFDNLVVGIVGQAGLDLVAICGLASFDGSGELFLLTRKCLLGTVYHLVGRVLEFVAAALEVFLAFVSLFLNQFAGLRPRFGGEQDADRHAESQTQEEK